ncbi:MAG: endonuclease/exonuclease/phosphatase family protein [Kiritimatiellae bacterium]|nr:endonuclease/exonuclease/phosphatase family protein [Kiritimatiellia bacterium]
MEFRILSYNVRAGRGLDGSPALDRQAAVIRALAPDVVALQEVDRCTQRSGGIDQAAALAESTGMHAVFARAIDFEGGTYGIAVLSLKAPRATRTVPLPSPHDEDRVLLAADFDDFTFAATHLSLDEADRLDAIDRIEAELLPSDKPVFLAGDWNAVPGDTTLRRVGRSFRLLSGTAPTFPADAPVKCIDYVAVDRAHAPLFAKSASHVVDEPAASDHRPVLVCVEL